MPNDPTPIAPNATGPDRIDLQSEAARATWAKKFDVTEQQLKEAVDAVGDKAADVELHLKGSRSSSKTRSV